MRATGLGLLVTVALLISSCSLAAAEGSVNVYTRNDSSDALGFRVDSAGGQSWSRIDTGGRGCTAVSVPWAISIGAAGRDGQEGDYRQLLSSAEVADPSSADIWIDVAADGSTSWGEGKPAWKPAWDEEDPLPCGPNE